MTELVKEIAKTTGLPDAQAKEVATEVLNYLKAEMPQPMAEEIDVIIGKDTIADREERSLGLFQIP